MHGAGNDFVVIDATRERFQPSAKLLKQLTDRHYGVGCDQVLVVEAPSTEDVDFDYRIFNSDGSEVGQCGNGARCLARFVAERKLTAKTRLRVRTSTSVLELERRAGGLVTVNMGVPNFTPADIPFLAPKRNTRYVLELDQRKVMFGAVSMGNPHLVMQVEDVDKADVDVLGPQLEWHPAFPQRVNVGFMQIVSRDQVRLRVWERGAGETLACGSGACAAMVLGRLCRKLDGVVKVELKGGRVVVAWSSPGKPVMLTGGANTVFRGELEWNE
jgi:diaminopimelate epimerase